MVVVPSNVVVNVDEVVFDTDSAVTIQALCIFLSHLWPSFWYDGIQW